MSKFDIRPQLDFECQNATFGSNSNAKTEFRMSKFDIRPQFGCQNRFFCFVFAIFDVGAIHRLCELLTAS